MTIKSPSTILQSEIPVLQAAATVVSSRFLHRAANM